VIGANGIVYVGTTDGKLVAVRPNGTRVWTQGLGPPGVAVLGSPLVDREGNISVVAAQESTATSMLFKFNPGGQQICTARIRGAVSSSPKGWGVDQELFVTVLTPDSDLIVFNRNCREVLRKKVCGATVEGGSIFTNPNPDYAPPPYPDATVAVVEFPSVTPPGHPLLIIAHRRCLRAFRWTPPDLREAWHHDWDRDHLFTSPAALPLGIVMLGVDATVYGFELSDGTLQWTYPANEWVVGTP
jgi:outer membrane protein assembly factor BamB